MNIFKKPISISFAPNVERDGLLLSLQLLLRLRRKETENSPKKLEEEFKKYFSAKYAFSFSSGRAALYFILKSLNLKKGDEILIQAFTCVAVPNSIIWAGLKPVYIDIEKETLNLNSKDLEKKITKKSKALIIQHTFGMPGPIEEILKIAKKHRLIVIEDGAHSLGAIYKGKKIGTFGDVSFFSFGRDKIISSVFGGMAITNNQIIANNLEQFQQNLSAPPLFFTLQQLLYPLIYSIGLLFFNIYMGRIFLKFCSFLKLLSKAVFEEEKQGKMPKFISYKLCPELSFMALHQFKRLNRFNLHRRSIAEIYQNKLGLKKQKTDVFSVFLRVHLLVETKQILLYSAKHKGIYLGDWYGNIIDPRGVDLKKVLYKIGLCPTAEKISKTIINLPTHINIKEKDALTIANFILKFRAI